MEGFLGILEKLGDFLQKMFSNPGRKLKTLAKVVFMIAIIASVICAFKFGIWTYSLWDGEKQTAFVAGLFFGFLLGGPVVSYIVCLMVSAFGELVENSSRKQ